MSLDLYLKTAENRLTTCTECVHPHEISAHVTLWHSNITHNLNAMFAEAGLYQILWHGTGLRAGDQIEKLKAGLAAMEADPVRFKKHDSPNGWGTYKHAVPWLREVIAACELYPDAVLECSR